MPAPRSIRSIVSELEKWFGEAGLDEARREARYLVAQVLGRPMHSIHAHPEYLVEAEQLEQIITLARRRSNREPLAWLTGSVDFCGLTFQVGPGVLVPRPDSETLVETARTVASRITGRSPLRLLDCCAGSGCIGISLAILLENDGRQVDLTLTELDPVAAGYAQANLIKHDLVNRARLVQTDLFPSAGEVMFDMIVANPPYIDSGVIDTLMPEVSRHEPRLALDGGPDGLAVCRRLIREAPARLDSPGWLLLEHGYDQEAPIAALLAAAGYSELLAVKDYGGQPRVSGGRMVKAEGSMADAGTFSSLSI